MGKWLGLAAAICLGVSTCVLATPLVSAEQEVVETIVLDVATREPLGGAVVSVATPTAQCMTNAEGRCDLQVPQEGRVTIAVSASGYVPQTVALTLPRGLHDDALTFALGRERQQQPRDSQVSYSEAMRTAPDSGDWIPISSDSVAEAVLSGATLPILRGEGRISISFSLPGLLRHDLETDQGQRTILSIPNGLYALEPGKPVIPAMTGKFVMPPGATVLSITTTVDEKVELEDIEPAIHIPMRVTPTGLVQEDIPLQELTSTYPEEFYRVTEIGALRDGNTLGTVSIWPVQFDPTTGSALVHTAVELEVVYSVPGLVEEERSISLLDDVPDRLGQIEVLPRGHRSGHEGQNLAADASLCDSATPRAFLVREDGRSEYSMISAGFWRDENSAGSSSFFGVMTYSDATDSQFVQAKQVQHLSDYGEVELVTSQSRVLELIRGEWAESPGLVLFGKPGHIGGSLVPLASYLNWPLVGVADDTDLAAAQDLANDLGVSNVIISGELPSSLLTWIEGGDMRVIRLDGQRQINQFFHLQKQNGGFYQTVKEHDLALYATEIINPDWTTALSAADMQYATLSSSPYYLVVVDQVEEGEFDVAAYQLAAYRSAEILEVGGYTANQIRTEINAYDPIYIAIFGDGDLGEASCFFVTDPTGDTEDPDEIGTDFYYEVRESLSVGQLTDGWVVDSYVGRPIGSTDAETQQYVDTVKRYEAGCLDADYLDWTVSGSITWDGGYEETAVDVSSYLGSVAPAATLLLEPSSPLYSQADDDFSKANYVEGTLGLDSGVTVGFAKGHGNDEAVALGSGGDADYLHRDHLAAHEDTWRDYPFLQYTDSCMTARFMGADGTWDFDDDVNLGCGFIDAGAIAYIGTTMHATAGYIDGINQEFFQHRITDWDYTLGQALAYARESWYDAQYYHSDWDKKTVLEMMLIGDPMVDLQLGSSEHPPSPPAATMPSTPSPEDDATGVWIHSDLDWADAAHATGYDVYFGTTSDPPFVGISSESDYDLPALEYDAHYFWKVVAKNFCGEDTAGATWDFFTTPCHTLNTDVSPGGSGSVSADPAPNCGGGEYVHGTSVQLTADATSGYEFSHWSGSASGSSNPTTISMDADKDVTGNFAPVCYGLDLAVSPAGGGTVSADPAPNCGDKYIAGTEVELTANPSTGYSFSYWSGSASGSSNPATITVDAEKNITANFTQVCYTLSTAASPAGGGTVDVSPLPNCTGGRYATGTQVQLTANPATGYSFSFWSGSASGSSNPTTITIDSDKSVTANFTQVCHSLNLSVDPSGGGTVSADPAPNCGGGLYAEGTEVQLTASPYSGYSFGYWTGDLDGDINPRTIAVDGDKNVTAHFVQQCYSLNTSVSPSGAGTVNANPAPNCAGGKYAAGTLVELTANAATGYGFSWWSGSASGSSNPTTITMHSDASVTANFAQICYDLAINVSPGGSGTVSPSPAPNCGGGKYTVGSIVELTANAASGYEFSHWSGQASGSANPTTVTMNASKGVTANFTEQTCYSLALSVVPGGAGTIAANPAPNCDGGKYLEDTLVELTAAPLGGYSFSSWIGDASGSENPTTVTMNADKSVTAGFTLICYTLSTSVSPGGAGTVSVSPDPNCPAGAYAEGTQVTLTAIPADGYNFSHWSGNASGSSNPLTFTMDFNKGIAGNFTATCFTLDTDVIPGGSGTISAEPAPNCAGDRYAADTVVDLTAHPADGYFFHYWSWDATGSDNPTPVVMDADKSVYAVFTYVGEVAEFPFYDGFEAGSLAPVWSAEEINEGRVRVDSAYYPYQGAYHLLLDDEVSGSQFSWSKAILAIDLTGQTDVLLDFWWREYDDRGHLDDGVYISDDLGANWHEIESFLDYQPYYGQEIIDIDAQASSLGLSLNDHFLIKFQFYGENPIPNDGFGIDEVKVRPTNSPPLLSWTGEPNYEQDGVHPESGDTGDEYSYRIEYSDPFDGDAPAHVYLHIEKGDVAIGGSPFDMACELGDYQAGVICSYAKSGFAEAGTDYTYYFTAEDSRGATSAATMELDGPDVSANNPPVLEWTGESTFEEDGLHPESGHINMDYMYRIKYSDADGDEPDEVQVHIRKAGAEIPGSPFAMSCYSDDYTAGVICAHLEMGFSESGWDYTYYFTAQDEHGAPAIPTIELDAPDLLGGDAQWTVLVYLNGDNDMEDEAIDDFLEMASVGSTNEVNIVVWFDRIPGYDDRYGDWSDFYRFFVTEGMTPDPENGTYTGEAWMGDYQNLLDFVNPYWERYSFPAEHYAVIIWDHGNSSRFMPGENTLFGDICFDETQYDESSESGISVPELRLALDDGTLQGADPLDLLGFDASLMGSIEIDDQLIPYAHLRVGSQEVQPSGGWPYDDILAALVTDPTMTPSEFAQVIVEAYHNEHALDFTQSAVDLQSAYGEVNAAVDGLATALMGGMNSHYLELVTARGNTQEFSEAAYVDLYDLAYQIGQFVNDATIDAAASALMNAVDAAVLAEEHGVGWPRAHGISIYFPEAETDYNGTYDGDQDWLEFPANTQWDEWLHAFYQGPVGDVFEPDDSSAEATIIDSGVPQTHSIVPVGDDDWVTFTLDEESEVIIETSGSSGDTRLWLYNSSEGLIESDDDDGVGLFSRIDRFCGEDALEPGTYYVRVDEYGDKNQIETYDLTITIDPGCQFCAYMPIIVRRYQPPEWTIVTSEGFEGGFPGLGWEVSDEYTGDGKEYYWAANDFLPRRGGWSASPAAGGTDAIDPDGSDYPSDCYSWMVYGPFDLTDATDAALSFYYWNHSELSDDYLFYGAATDGISFWGTKISGNSDGWRRRSLDLTDVPSLGDLTGQSEVWIALVFRSDSDTNVFQGAFLDDIVLRKLVGIGGAPASLAGEGVSFAPPDTLLVETGAMELRLAEDVWTETDATSTATATCTSTPTPTMTPTPTITPTVVITPTATTSPMPASTMTPTSTITATATLTGESTPTVQGSSIPTDAVMPDPSPCPTPEDT